MTRPAALLLSRARVGAVPGRRAATAKSSVGFGTRGGASGWRARCVAHASSSSSSSVDAVVVVAGGMTPEGGLPEWVTPRLDYAYEAYARAAEGDKPRILLSGSMTPHKPPPMAKGGFNLHESTAMAEYLIEKGVPANSLLKDTASMDTIGNAYYSLCLHAIPRGWSKVEVVTSAFHMARTQAAFEWVWKLSPTGPIDMQFVSTEDAGISESALKARATREAESAAALRANAARVTTFAAFNEWLFTTHKCYAVSRQHEIGDFSHMDQNDEALKSY
jgi:uncharacterized SAM-binding protein YcdF (DUF218 family)